MSLGLSRQCLCAGHLRVSISAFKPAWAMTQFASKFHRYIFNYHIYKIGINGDQLGSGLMEASLAMA